LGLTRKEENDDQRVEDGEPLDVGVGHALQDVVPSDEDKMFIIHPGKISCRLQPTQ